MQWIEDKHFSDKFLPQIKYILSEHLLIVDSQEDSLRNSDLVVYRMETVRIACRIRRYKYFAKYKHQFTIRKSRPSDAKSEIAKIIEGWGDFFFYGFSNEEETNLVFWSLCDLTVFRLWFGRQLFSSPEKILPGEHQYNDDGSSDFVVFNFADLPQDFIISQSNQEE